MEVVECQRHIRELYWLLRRRVVKTEQQRDMAASLEVNDAIMVRQTIVLAAGWLVPAAGFHADMQLNIMGLMTLTESLSSEDKRLISTIWSEPTEIVMLQ